MFLTPFPALTAPSFTFVAGMVDGQPRDFEKRPNHVKITRYRSLWNFFSRASNTTSTLSDRIVDDTEWPAKRNPGVSIRNTNSWFVRLAATLNLWLHSLFQQLCRLSLWFEPPFLQSSAASRGTASSHKKKTLRVAQPFHDSIGDLLT
jgi:hypothetical protein